MLAFATTCIVRHDRQECAQVALWIPATQRDCHSHEGSSFVSSSDIGDVESIRSLASLFPCDRELEHEIGSRCVSVASSSVPTRLPTETPTRSCLEFPPRDLVEDEYECLQAQPLQGAHREGASSSQRQMQASPSSMASSPVQRQSPALDIYDVFFGSPSLPRFSSPSPLPRLIARST